MKRQVEAITRKPPQGAIRPLGVDRTSETANQYASPWTRVKAVIDFLEAVSKHALRFLRICSPNKITRPPVGRIINR